MNKVCIDRVLEVIPKMRIIGEKCRDVALSVSSFSSDQCLDTYIKIKKESDDVLEQSMNIVNTYPNEDASLRLKKLIDDQLVMIDVTNRVLSLKVALTK